MSQIPFYKAEKIAEDSYLIKNDFVERVPSLCYLIVGKDYALLIDSCFGWGDLKAFCATITDKPVKLVNTHAHGDHVAGNVHFDSCYMHYRDIRYMSTMLDVPAEVTFTMAQNTALPEYRDLLELDDNFKTAGPKMIYPLSGSDIFDMGDREVEVVYAGGHTPGSIVLIDHKTRILYGGDFCNSNTLMEFKMSLTVEAYLENLREVRKHASEFDIMYCGHEILDPAVIDEGIETCERVLAGTDDRFEGTGMFGQPVIYAAAKDEDGKRADGKRFNMSYDPAKVHGKDNTTQVITAEPVVMA